MDRNHIIKFLSCFIPLKVWRHYFRDKYILKSSIIKDCGKNNKFILLDDNGNKMEIKYLENLSIEFLGDNNYIQMYSSTKLQNRLYIKLNDSNNIKIGKSPYQLGMYIHSPCNSIKLNIGDNVSMWGTNIQMVDEPGLELEIGNDVMMGYGVLIRPSDGHTIYDSQNKILNYPEKISIGNHCWLGMNTTVLKGADMPDNSVLAAGSIYTKSSNPKDKALTGCIFAGAPAKVIKTGINWNRLNTYQYEKSCKKMAKTVDMTEKSHVGGGAPLIELYQAFPARKVA